jgi:hypothetical protein
MAKALTLKTIFQAVDKMSGPTKTITSKMEKYGKVAQNVGKGLAVVGAATLAAGLAVGKAAADFAVKGDEIAKTSRMLGLSTDALQELRYAAGIQGVSDEQLTTGLKLLNNQLGQLKTKEGTLYTTLAKTNPKLALQLRDAKDTSSAFDVMMGAIASETNVQTRATLAQAAFGKSGQELIKFSNGGAAAIEELRKEAHKYGAVIDEKALLSSEKFDDSLSRLKLSLRGVANQGLGMVVEKMQPMIQQWADFIASNHELISLNVEKVFRGIGRGLEIVTAPGMLKGILALAVGIKAVGIATTFMGAGNPWVLLIGGLVTLITLIVANWDKITGFFDRVNSANSKQGGSGNVADYGTPGSAISEMYGSNPDGVDMAPVVSSSSSSVSRSEVAVDFSNLPQGARVKQSGAAPGVSLSVGRQMVFGGGR